MPLPLLLDLCLAAVAAFVALLVAAWASASENRSVRPVILEGLRRLVEDSYPWLANTVAWAPREA